MLRFEVIVFGILIILWVVSIIYAVRLGFNMGRQVVDKPVSNPKDQGVGQPVLAEYSPYDDAMGDDSYKETVK